MQKRWYIKPNKTGLPKFVELTATEAQAITALGPFATIEEAQRQFGLAFPKTDWR